MNVLGQTRSAVEEPSLAGGFEIRPLERGDRRRVTAVVDEWWGRPMAGLLPHPFFSEFRNTSFLVERDGELVAFLVGFLSQTNAEEAYIHAVAVAPACRGRGIGQLLYERFFEVVQRHGRGRIRAITSPVNEGSVAFHRRLGFAVEMPAEAEGDDGRVQFLLELPEPTSIDLDSASAYQAAATLRRPLAGSLITLDPLTERHERISPRRRRPATGG
jgi:ribosomal protein S18 acetylase RimI-like enzyme